MQSSIYRYRLPLLGAAVLVGASAIALVVWQNQHQSRRVAIAMAGGDPARAPDIIRRYGCAGCHTIPGIPGGDGKVGGPLADIRSRVYVGGVVDQYGGQSGRLDRFATDVFAAISNAGYGDFANRGARRRDVPLFAMMWLTVAAWDVGVAT